MSHLTTKLALFWLSFSLLATPILAMENQEKTDQINQLPKPVVHKILYHVIFGSIFSENLTHYRDMRLTCKNWNELIQKDLFQKKAPIHKALFNSGRNAFFSSFTSISEKDFDGIHIPKIRGSRPFYLTCFWGNIPREEVTDLENFSTSIQKEKPHLIFSNMIQNIKKMTKIPQMLLRPINENTLLGYQRNEKGLKIGQFLFVEQAAQANGLIIHKSLTSDVYIGDYKAGKKHGKGDFWLSNGDYYKGEFKNGKENASGKDNEQGTIIFQDGRKYIGEFKDGKCHGIGRLKLKNGDLYEGWFQAGYPQDMGFYTYQSGEKYEGFFQMGKFHGKGFLTFPNGGYYEGQFQMGQFHGDGLLCFQDGRVYKGNFHDDQICGLGSMAYPNGNKYEGQFQMGKFHGDGILCFQDGRVYKGNFHDGQICGLGSMAYPNGNKYEGQFQNNKKNGKGVLYFKNGEIYNGDFKDDMFHGTGTFTLVNGTRCIGNSELGKPYGKRTLINAKGVKLEIVFEEYKIIQDAPCYDQEGNVLFVAVFENRKATEETEILLKKHDLFILGMKK